MSEPADEDRRLCPTRASGVSSLIAHLITPGVCLQRQRANYHKCPSCRYRGLSAEVKLAPLVADVVLTPRPPPPRAPSPPKPAKPRRARVKVSKAS